MQQIIEIQLQFPDVQCKMEEIHLIRNSNIKIEHFVNASDANGMASRNQVAEIERIKSLYPCEWCAVRAHLFMSLKQFHRNDNIRQHQLLCANRNRWAFKILCLSSSKIVGTNLRHLKFLTMQFDVFFHLFQLQSHTTPPSHAQNISNL